MPAVTRKRFARPNSSSPVRSRSSMAEKLTGNNRNSTPRRSKRICAQSPDSDTENHNPVLWNSTQLLPDEPATPTPKHRPSRSSSRKILSNSQTSSGSRRGSPMSLGEEGFFVDAASRQSPDIPSLILKAKSLFRLSSLPSRLVGRDGEVNKVKEFIESHVSGGDPASLYISGAPGTGKTALVENLLKTHLGKGKNFGIVQINCMSVGDQPKTIFARILSKMDESASTTGMNSDAIAKLIESLISVKSKKRWLIMLDEIDQLLTKDQDILYRIFEWPMLKDSKCTIIGIANALDLTQRFLPRLVAKNRAPTHVAFSPYSSEQIVEIIKDRLQDLLPYSGADGGLLMQNAAIELCARKVSAIGDARKALDICRQAIELMDIEFKKNNHIGSPLSNKTRENMPAVLPKVTVQHVLKVINSSFGAVNPSVSKIRGLTVQQKLILMLIFMMQDAMMPLTVSTVFDVYLSVCTQDCSLLEAASRSQYFDMIAAIEAVGLMTFAKASGKILQQRLQGHTSTPVKNKPANGNSSTPKSSAIVKTPPSRGKLTPTGSLKKGSSFDGSSRLILNISTDELKMGIQNVPILEDFFQRGLPTYVTNLENIDGSNEKYIFD